MSQDLLESAQNNELDDLYNPEEDDLDYSELISAGYVLDETGAVEVKEFSQEEIEHMKKLSVLGISYVPSGRSFFDAWKSNLQKCVRRCDILGALKSVQETCDLEGPFLSNIVNRLCKVMVSEDIGPAEPWIAKECYNFLLYYEKRKELWKTTKKIGEIEGSANITFVNDIAFKNRLLLITQKLAMYRKSRLCDNAIHSARTKSIKGKTFDEVFDAFKSWVDNHEENPDTYFGNSIKYLKMLLGFKGKMDKQLDVKKDPSFMRELLGRRKALIYVVWKYILDKSKIDGKLFEINCYLLGIFNMAGDESVLLIINALLNLLFFYENKLDFDDSICNIKTIKCSWESLRKKNDIWIKDISFDKHTKLGRELGRDGLFFWRYGAKIVNKNKLLDEYDRKYYNLCMKNCLENRK